MSVPTLQGFVFFIFPIAIVGQIWVVVSKFSEGAFRTDILGLPNVVIQLCCLATIGVMTIALRSCWQEFKSRTKEDASNKTN